MSIRVSKKENFGSSVGGDCEKDDACGRGIYRRINYMIKEDDRFKKLVLVFTFQIVVCH